MEALSPDLIAGFKPDAGASAPSGPAAAAAAAPTQGPVTLSDADLAGFKPDPPAFMAGRGGGYDDVKLAPTEAAPRTVASESKVPGHQGELEREDAVVPEVLSVLHGVKSGARGLYGALNDAGNQIAEVGIGAGKRLAANPLASVGETFQDTLADPRFQRQAMRGVNGAVMPFVGNKLVAAVGGPSEHSDEDAAAFPRAEALGGLVGSFAPIPYGEIAAAAVKPAKSAVRGLLGAVERAGAGAEERQVGRAVEDITDRAMKKQRLGLEKSEDKVEALARENPEIVAHARNDDALAVDVQNIRKRASGKLGDLYAERDLAAGRKPVATDLTEKAAQEEERAAAAKAEAAANPSGSGAREAAEREATEAQARADQLRRDAAKRISDRPAHGISMADPVSNLDASISRMANGDPTERLASTELKRIRDELVNAKGADGIIPAQELRTEQSARQTIGYAKAMPGMPDYELTNAKILANRQASRDIGDSIVKHVTGMGYDEAKAAAAADPTSIAGRLFKLNGEIEGASRIEAAMASKKGRAKGGIADLIHALTSPHGKRAGALGTASLALGEFSHLMPEGPIASAARTVATGLGAAAGVAAAAPRLARVADNALAAAGRGAEALSAKLTPATVNEVIELAAAPTTSFADVVAEGTKRGLPVRVAAQIATSAGKTPSPVAPPPGLPLMAQQEASP